MYCTAGSWTKPKAKTAVALAVTLPRSREKANAVEMLQIGQNAAAVPDVCTNLLTLSAEEFGE